MQALLIINGRGLGTYRNRLSSEPFLNLPARFTNDFRLVVISPWIRILKNGLVVRLCLINSISKSENKASIKFLEKTGFEREGVLKANVYKDGKIVDQALYAKIKEGI